MDLSQLSLPPWFATTTKSLMHVAEDLFGSGAGADKKAWVRNALLDAAKVIDIPQIPNFIENPIKEAIVNLVIEIIWSLHFQEPDLGRIVRAGRALRA